MKKVLAISSLVVGLLFTITSCSKQDTPRPGGQGWGPDPNGGNKSGTSFSKDSGPTMDPLGGGPRTSTIAPEQRGFSIDPNGGSGN